MPGQRARPVRRAGTGRPTPARVHGVSSPTQPLNLMGRKGAEHSGKHKDRDRSWSSASTCAPSISPSVRIAIVCDSFSPT